MARVQMIWTSALLLVVVLSAGVAVETSEPATTSGLGVARAECPVRLLEVEAVGDDAEGLEGIRLAQGGLDYLDSLSPPSYLVPALGVFRGGKSLLLNRLRGLQAPYTGGFGVGHGQQTFTRGIDVCAEEVDGLGTVVWMDTEGLFSAEDARSAYGPKLFSLALLFSSIVLLNSVKVLNDQFFSFFSEQQQVARALRQGLAAEGLPLDSLLPMNLSVFWVLQQPVKFSGINATNTRSQLEAFLSAPGDEARAGVRRDFRHHMHEVPVASPDVRTWGRLHELPDEELLPEYVSSTQILRQAIFGVLREGTTRPMQAASIGKQLAMYVDLVKHDRLSGSLAKEAFEEAQMGEICGRFATAVAQRAGVFPTKGLQAAIQESRHELDSGGAAAKEAFHFGAAWSRKLEECATARAEDLWRRNGEQALQQWQIAVSEVAEQGSCFFLGPLARLLRAYIADYGSAFGPAIQARAVDFASALQRARLVECVRLRDLLWPLLPWLAWPVCNFYLRGGTLSGILSMGLHAVALSGIYVMLQMFHQLPPYLDVDYPVLKHYPLLLHLVMRAPPLVPWGDFVRVLGLIGAARSGWKILRRLVDLGRPAGSTHEVAQLVNLELKLNMVLKRSEAMFKQQLAAAALDAAERLDRGENRAAQAALLRGLCLARELGDEDFQLVAQLAGGCGAASSSMRRQANATMDRVCCGLTMCVGGATTASRRSSRERVKRHQNTRSTSKHNLYTLVACGDWQALLDHMTELLEAEADVLAEQAADVEDGSEKPITAANPSLHGPASDEDLVASDDEEVEAEAEVEGEPEEEAAATGSSNKTCANRGTSWCRWASGGSHSSPTDQSKAARPTRHPAARVPSPARAGGKRKASPKCLDSDEENTEDDEVLTDEIFASGEEHEDSREQPSSKGSFFYWAVVGGSASLAVAALISNLG